MSATHRRDFVRIALGATAGLTAGSAAAPADDEPKKETTPSEVDARMELVLARFGAQLDDAARKEIRGEVEAIVHRAERLRKFELTNGDEPMPVFRPYRAPLA